MRHQKEEQHTTKEHETQKGALTTERRSETKKKDNTPQKTPERRQTRSYNIKKTSKSTSKMKRSQKIIVSWNESTSAITLFEYPGFFFR